MFLKIIKHFKTEFFILFDSLTEEKGNQSTKPEQYKLLIETKWNSTKQGKYLIQTLFMIKYIQFPIPSQSM